MVVQHRIVHLKLEGTVRDTMVIVHLPSLPTARSACATSNRQHMYAAGLVAIDALQRVPCCRARQRGPMKGVSTGIGAADTYTFDLMCSVLCSNCQAHWCKACCWSGAFPNTRYWLACASALHVQVAFFFNETHASAIWC